METPPQYKRKEKLKFIVHVELGGTEYMQGTGKALVSTGGRKKPEKAQVTAFIGVSAGKTSLGRVKSLALMGLFE